jgi:UDP-N-acetylmuramate dehydrogenase
MTSSLLVQERNHTALSELTTLRLGGPARRLIEIRREDELLEAMRMSHESLLVMAGGSNLVIADEGFDGTVVRIANRGTSFVGEGDRVRVLVAAGEPWDALVASCVEERLAGIECLSGIPGSAGATPIQNVGAYGQEVASTIASVRTYDRKRQQVDELGPDQCGFAYRSSAFKGSDRHVVLGVSIVLERSPLSLPVSYAELARTLGCRSATAHRWPRCAKRYWHCAAARGW